MKILTKSRLARSMIKNFIKSQFARFIIETFNTVDHELEIPLYKVGPHIKVISSGFANVKIPLYEGTSL